MVKIPPLRDRLDDLGELINHFILTLNKSLGTNVRSISDEVMNLFRGYNWPGNIRELEHLLEGALNIIGYDEELSMKHFSAVFESMENLNPSGEELPGDSVVSREKRRPSEPVPVASPGSGKTLVEHQAEQEKKAVSEVLLATGGNITRAAALLGISRQLLHYKMKKHGLVRSVFMPDLNS
jgi:arginine utilization regulatory protein